LGLVLLLRHASSTGRHAGKSVEAWMADYYLLALAFISILILSRAAETTSAWLAVSDITAA
jgi:hypothetical protein